MPGPIASDTLRAREARFGKSIGRSGFFILASITVLAALGAAALFFVHEPHFGLLLAALALVCYMPAIWWKRYLSVIPVQGNDLNGRLTADVLTRVKPGLEQQPQTIWQALADHWQVRFFSNHLLLTTDSITPHLGTTAAELEQALNTAVKFADDNNLDAIGPGLIAAGLLSSAPGFSELLRALKDRPEDIAAMANWLARDLKEQRQQKQRYGGIARDWVFGFTPLLDRLGHNLSRGIMQHGAHFGWLTTSAGVTALETACQSQSGAVALIGPNGIGKTSSVYALAQRLIEGQTTSGLAYHQIVSLNAADILSRANGPGALEHIMISIANEAAHAGHIILFFDDAELFFGGGPGAFDATQILLPIVQAGTIPMILAMSPPDYQRLKASNPSLANLLSPVVLQEMPEPEVMRVLEDTVVGLEHRNRVVIAYGAIHEAYRLSGRYDQDEAYPGKAIKLLEASVNFAANSAVTTESVQRAVEQAYGVKATAAAPVEADALLHLEDSIHERMINQTHAVSVVANALRRARAGVTNPRRPIGSFLFLGPTGVGKTELAKAIAATYFGAESNLIRLDMSEYQQPDDVQRLLASGENAGGSLLLSVRQQPFSVVLLDEIEKAHPNVLNLLLQLLDEGQLTDVSGRPASFKDCVIIVTSNAGAQEIRDKIAAGEQLENFAGELTDKLISSGQFKPEILNRFDEIVLFRPLTPDELGQVVQLMVAEVNKTLANQNISIELTQAAIQKIVEVGNDPRLGARPMRRALQRAVEDTVAQKILRGEARPGDHLALDVADLAL